MKNTSYLILLAFSFLMIPPLLLMYYGFTINSEYYYIHNFKENKIQFEKIVELRVAEHTSENTEAFDEVEFEKLKTTLRKSCRVDSVDLHILSDNKIYVAFPMSDSMYYPSTEDNYRMILYQSDDELPEQFNDRYNKRISKNWFYVTNDQKALQQNLITLCLTVFVLFVWISGIIKLVKIIKSKQKSQ